MRPVFAILIIVLIVSMGLAQEPLIPICGSTQTIIINEYDNRMWTYYDLKKSQTENLCPIESQLYKWKQLYEFDFPCRNEKNEIIGAWLKWKKIPYEIEGWHCVEYSSITILDPNCHERWKYYQRESGSISDTFLDDRYPPNCEDKISQSCLREEGYRKDGMVVFRRIKEAK